jgi:AbiV family abortive infection protein
MGQGLRRLDLQNHAQTKLDDATLLLQNGRFSNAYYLAGYAVELGLKACISRQMLAETIPDKTLLRRVFDHDPRVLVGLAGLARQLQEQEDKDPNFAANWALAAQWTPESRYETVDQASGQTLISAISDPTSGVLQWIKTHW